MTLLEYLSAKGYTINQTGPGQYNGLPDENGVAQEGIVYDEKYDKWMWKERSKSGFGLEDYLKKVLNITEEEIKEKTEEAKQVEEAEVIPEEVIEKASETVKKKEKKKKQRILSPSEEENEGVFTMPPHAAAMHEVDKFYIGTKSISPNLLQWFKDLGLLYESNEQYQLADRKIFYHNATFVCVDKNLIAKGAISQFLRPNKRGELSLSIVPNSDVSYGFSRIGENCQVLLVFETILEMLSYFTLSEMNGKSFYNQPFICIEGYEFSSKILPQPLRAALLENPKTRAVFFAASRSNEETVKGLAETVIEKTKRKAGVILPIKNTFEEDLLSLCPPKISFEKYVAQFQ